MTIGRLGRKTYGNLRLEALVAKFCDRQSDILHLTRDDAAKQLNPINPNGQREVQSVAIGWQERFLT